MIILKSWQKAILRKTKLPVVVLITQTALSEMFSTLNSKKRFYSMGFHCDIKEKTWAQWFYLDARSTQSQSLKHKCIFTE